MEKTNATVPERFSIKVRGLSFLAMVFVLLIHAYNYQDVFLQPATRLAEGLFWPAMLEFFFSNALTRFANPLFFTISGYLALKSVTQMDWHTYTCKIRSRISSLAVPFVFWVLLWTCIALLMRKAGIDLPILNEKLVSWDKAPLFGMVHDPVSFQFWYLRDLAKLIILLPVFNLLAKEFGFYSLLMFIMPWAMDISFPYLPNCDALLFFQLGAVFAAGGYDEKLAGRLQSRVWLFIPLMWILSCAGLTFLSAGLPDVSDLILLFMYKFCVVSGLLSVYILYDFLPERMHGSDFVTKLTKSSFLIFAIHEPLQHMIFQSVLRNLNSDGVHLALYFGLPVAFIVLSVLLSELLSRYAPGLRRFLTGKR